jgi:hypothetical protein
MNGFVGSVFWNGFVGVVLWEQFLAAILFVAAARAGLIR